MLSDAAAALSEIVSPPFRAVLVKSIALTLGLLAGLGVALWIVLTNHVTLPWDWAQIALEAAAGLGLFVGLVFLVAPVSSLIAGFFLDDIAEVVEARAFPADPPGRELPLGRSLVLSIKFFGAVVLANLAALVLLFVPGINLIAFFLANGYLLGREYFEMAALRHRPYDDARALRRTNGGRVFAAGLLVALMVLVPVVNLLTPLFATALMVRLHKRISRDAGMA